MSPPEPSLCEQLALVQLPARMGRALRLFRRITGRIAVASVANSAPELSPPLHPRCAKSLRSISAPPCGARWSAHLRASRRSARVHVHTCPIGLRCSCVPIHFQGRLVGVAKLVVEADTPDADLKTCLNVLHLVISETCKDSTVSVLSEELSQLRQISLEQQELLAAYRPDGREADARHGPSEVAATDGAGAALVSRALAHLQRHYQDPALSLRSLARALECNPNYLTSRFTRIVGGHMHTYLVTLRLSHACRLLVSTGQAVKAVAAASGFPRSSGMTSAFRTHVGVSPKEYRRIFARP